MTKDYINTSHAGFVPCYRLAYNLIAVLTLIPIAIVHFHDNSSPILLWPEWSKPLTLSITLAALSGFIWSLRYYDMSVFSGFSSCLKKTTASSSEGFCISPMHRFVRHPWYLFAIIIIWSRDQSSIQLISSTLVTVYFFIGAKFEERKLLREFGQSYRDYIQDVPGIIPRPWKWLSTARMKQILDGPRES